MNGSDSDLSCSFDDINFEPTLSTPSDTDRLSVASPPLETPPHSPSRAGEQQSDSASLDDTDLGDSPFQRSKPISAIVGHSRQAVRQWRRWRAQQWPDSGQATCSSQERSSERQSALSAPNTVGRSALRADDIDTGLDPVFFGAAVRLPAESSATDSECIATPVSPYSDGRRASQRRNRCAVCGKKLSLLGFDCSCGGRYCTRHRTGLRQTIYGRSENDRALRGHLCAHDFAAEHADRLAAEMQRTRAQQQASHGYSETI